MNYLATETHTTMFLQSIIDWSQVMEGGVSTVIVGLVFAVIVRPLITMLVETNKQHGQNMARHAEGLVALTGKVNEQSSTINTNTNHIGKRLETKLDLMQENLSGYAKNTEERLEALEQRLHEVQARLGHH